MLALVDALDKVSTTPHKDWYKVAQMNANSAGTAQHANYKLYMYNYDFRGDSHFYIIINTISMYKPKHIEM